MVFLNKISFTSIKFEFKIITVTVELKIYFEIKDINSIKSWMCGLGVGGLWCRIGNIHVLQCYFPVVSQGIGCPGVP
jgi:hypothetical protein